MAIVSVPVPLNGKVEWDDAWAARAGSDAGYFWRIVTSSGADAPGVTILNPRSLNTYALFENAGTYKAILYVSDGAILVASDSKDITSSGDGEIDIPDLPMDPITIPVKVQIPSGTGVFQKLDAVLDVDTTGSMGGAISTAKSRCSEIVNAFLTGGRDVRCAVVDHRDVGDAWVSTIRSHLSSDLTTIQNAINAMSAAGGGDGPEAQIYSIYNTCNSLAWREGSLRVYIQFTDAPAHDPRNGVEGAQAITAMTSRNVVFIGVDCATSDYGSSAYLHRMATATDGYYFNLGSGATGIVGAIEEALTRMSTDLTVELVADADAPPGLVRSITPVECEIGTFDDHYFYNQQPGSRFTFNVVFARGDMTGTPPTGTRTYTFKLVIREKNTMAFIDEVPVKVTVNFDRTT